MEGKSRRDRTEEWSFLLILLRMDIVGVTRFPEHMLPFSEEKVIFLLNTKSSMATGFSGEP